MSSQRESSGQPNIVFILSDDQGWGDLSLCGNHNLSTPRIDHLGQRGAVFDSFFVQPLCAPTRAEVLTGRYFPRTGVKGVTRRAECLNMNETTLGDVFQQAGYATGCFGKWHSGSAYPYHPNGRGFQEFFGFCCGHWSHYFNSTLERNGEEVECEGYIVDVLTEAAMDFIEDKQDVPFCCYVPLNTPHAPFQVPDRWFAKFGQKDLEMRHRDPEKEDLQVTRSVLAMCENIDWNVGRLIDKVDELGLTENTIFIYLSDNGPNSWRWNGGMRGKKGSTDEGGMRSPCIFSWLGHITSGRRISRLAADIDLLPTLADLAEVSLYQTKPLDGVSLKPLLFNETDDWPDRAFFGQSPDGSITSIRTQQYRAEGHTGGLYDMTQDIGQDEDLSQQHPDHYAELRQRIADWRADVLPVDSDGDRPIPVGYPAFPKTYLNAQDADPTGAITWSSVHPNASYFINWHNLQDTISWDIDVQNAGTYEITVMYSCPESDVGAVLAFVSDVSLVTQSITEPFDPPVKDQDDRVPRAESYEKPFKPLSLGKLFLYKGRQRLELRALEKPGQTVCDVRAVKLLLTST